jgi:hypothetical protein
MITREFSSDDVGACYLDEGTAHLPMPKRST